MREGLIDYYFVYMQDYVDYSTSQEVFNNEIVTFSISNNNNVSLLIDSYKELIPNDNKTINND